MKDISRELIKIAKRLVVAEIDQKLYSARTKQTAKNLLHKYIDPEIKGIFRDEYWRGPNETFKKIRNLGVDLEVTVKDGGYFNDRDTGEIKGKKYLLDIEYTNIEGKLFKFEGSLICSFCGTVSDPMSAYDMIFQIY